MGKFKVFFSNGRTRTFQKKGFGEEKANDGKLDFNRKSKKLKIKRVVQLE